MNLIRCAWAGSQRYGALVWSGDISSSYEDFRRQICAGIHMSLSGIPWWTTDIGGFNGGNVEDEDFRKLLIRWFQFGTFCPVMRALFYEFPNDKACWDITDSYMFGSDILVAPVCHEKARSRQVYLPAGAAWTHVGTGEVYEGGNVYEVEAPINTLPVFLRDGKQGYLIGEI